MYGIYNTYLCATHLRLSYMIDMKDEPLSKHIL